MSESNVCVRFVGRYSQYPELMPLDRTRRGDFVVLNANVVPMSDVEIRTPNG